MSLLVIGLGNPDPRYAPTRHNAGFWVVDAIGQRVGLRFRRAIFGNYSLAYCGPRSDRLAVAKPLVGMNRSGEAIETLLRKSDLNFANLLVVYDTLDLPPGHVRLKRGGGSAGHNGLRSIIERCGRQDFMRLAIGIGRPLHSGGVARFVLSPPPAAERQIIDQAVARAADSLLRLQSEPIEQIMNDINRRASTSDTSAAAHTR